MRRDHLRQILPILPGQLGAAAFIEGEQHAPGDFAVVREVPSAGEETRGPLPGPAEQRAIVRPEQPIEDGGRGIRHRLALLGLARLATPPLTNVAADASKACTTRSAAGR